MTARSFGPWLRLYASILDDPKIDKLPDLLHRLWIKLLAVACKSGGKIPDDIEDLQFMLRRPPRDILSGIENLAKRGLLDPVEGGWIPHNWEARQFVSDSSTPRVQAFRKRRKGDGGNVSGNGNETLHETDQSRVKKVEARTPNQTQLPHPESHKPSLKLRIFGSVAGNGMGNGESAQAFPHVTIADANERVARFQAKIAKQLGPNGFAIVGSAVDPKDPDHARNLALCKQTATAMGKGWPRSWL